ncbi:MAG: NAD(P)/FAD-dependent oxidoreductase [Chloroflexi bacterium AL-W]|nr:NAD(P)/FAD-dependent oxidoreductase [Chloroflexi bacterium AL-W]
MLCSTEPQYCKTPLDIAFDADGVTITTGPEQHYRTAYSVDAGGFRSLLADKFDLRDFGLHTHSRSSFTHMINVPDFHEVSTSQKAANLPFSVAEGTLHHVFEGGWLWVIPFNNHAAFTNPLCSVGLMLDPRMHPPQNDLSAEEEFFAFIERFPSVAAQFRNARSVREWVRTGRIQYSSKQIVGDRWALLGHAAGFIDPLYSKGLYITLTSVSILAHHLLQAHHNGDYSRERFLPLEKTTLAYIHSNDRLVANSYTSWGTYQLWTAYSVLWLLGAYTELVKLFSIRIQSMEHGKINQQQLFDQLQQIKLAGGFADYDRVAHTIDTIIEAVDLTNAHQVATAVEQIQVFFTQLTGCHYLSRLC